MLLIVDSGSTKTDWCFVDSASIYKIVKTDGINPVVQTEEIILNILQKQLLPQINLTNLDITHINSIAFYGAGCISAKKLLLASILNDFFNCKNGDIDVESDLLGAARALCGNNAGIACILGTGSNSCIYDGTNIIQNTPALGYILGDEGSGAVLGKLFINAVLKGLLPNEICHSFFKDSKLDKESIISKVYKVPMANKFLASLSKYIVKNIKHKEVENLVVQNFSDFIEKNIMAYDSKYKTINCIGSIGFYYQKQLQMAAERHGYKTGLIIKSPLEALIKYHTSKSI